MMFVVLEKQTSAIKSFVTGRDALVVLPTGSEKSLTIDPLVESIFSLGPPLLTGAGRLQLQITLLTTTMEGEPVCAPKMSNALRGKSRIAELLATARWQNGQHVSPNHEHSDSAGLLLSRPTVLKSLHWFTNRCVDRPL